LHVLAYWCYPILLGLILRLYGWIASYCLHWCMLLMLLMHLNMCSCCFTVIPLHNSCMDLLCNPSWMNGLLMNCICSDA
jgi:hypothetical protein